MKKVWFHNTFAKNWRIGCIGYQVGLFPSRFERFTSSIHHPGGWGFCKQVKTSSITSRKQNPPATGRFFYQIHPDVIHISTVYTHVHILQPSQFGAPQTGCSRLFGCTCWFRKMPSYDVPQLEARHLVEASSLEAANYRLATLRPSAATCRCRHRRRSWRTQSASETSGWFFSNPPIWKTCKTSKLKHFFHNFRGEN